MYVCVCFYVCICICICVLCIVRILPVCTICLHVYHIVYKSPANLQSTEQMAPTTNKSSEKLEKQNITHERTQPKLKL